MQELLRLAGFLEMVERAMPKPWAVAVLGLSGDGESPLDSALTFAIAGPTDELDKAIESMALAMGCSRRELGAVELCDCGEANHYIMRTNLTGRELLTRRIGRN